MKMFDASMLDLLIRKPMAEQLAFWKTEGATMPTDTVVKGKTYPVVCASNGAFGWMPIVPFIHRDTFPHNIVPFHAHYDARFLGKRERAISNTGRDFRTVKVIYLGTNHALWDVTRLRIVSMICRTDSHGGIAIESLQHQYHKDFADRYLGKSCKGKQCPHWGMEMVNRGGNVLECPLHGLMGDAITERIISTEEALTNLDYQPIEIRR